MMNDVAAHVREAMDFEVAPHRPIIGSQINVEEGIGHRNLDDPPESPMGSAGELVGRTTASSATTTSPGNGVSASGRSATSPG